MSNTKPAPLAQVSTTPSADTQVTGRLWFRGKVVGSFKVPIDEFADFAAALEADGTTTVERDEWACMTARGRA
jgi:hypothetical protein